jgi:UDP-N-acetyl-D-mannosaminuronic acid dehydrogenase
VCYDRDAAAVDQVRAAKMPFFEAGAGELLERVLASGRFEASDDPHVVADAEHVVVVVGTPVDEHLNPDPKFVLRAIEEMVDELRDGQLLVLRSTVYPGVTAMVERTLAKSGRKIDVSFCPERIAEGRALVELRELPQIVSPAERRRATPEALFRRLTHPSCT